MHAMIVSAGPLSEAFLRACLADEKPDIVIAADAGFKACLNVSRMPDVIVGDYDSLPDALAERIPKSGQVLKETYRAEKDFTDTEAAVRKAVELGAGSITMVGATGKRLDHFIGNLFCLSIALSAGIPACIKDEYNEIRLIDKKTELIKEKTFGSYVSILPFTEKAEGVTLKGFRYLLSDAVLTKDNSLGISNEIIDVRAEVDVAEGILLLIFSKD